MALYSSRRPCLLATIALLKDAGHKPHELLHTELSAWCMSSSPVLVESHGPLGLQADFRQNRDVFKLLPEPCNRAAHLAFFLRSVTVSSFAFDGGFYAHRRRWLLVSFVEQKG